MTLSAPFPWFGGKSRVASVIWERFGTVRNYVEPFFGSGAVLLARPRPFDGVETINDLDGFVANFWRSIRLSPQETARWADWPVSEADLHARHYWLVTEGRARLAPLLGDPEGHDPQVAGWWVWGLCCWIGSGWCSGAGPWVWTGAAWEKSTGGVSRKLPHLGDAGKGINRNLPHLGDRNGGEGKGMLRPSVDIPATFAALSARLARVRIACGDWSRVTGDSVTWRHGPTAVFLDPPYAMAERAAVYATDTDVSAEVRAWAIEAGRHPDMRICLAAYDGEHAMPEGWTAHRWKANGGYGSQGTGRGRANAARETLWFSPACQPARQEALL